MIRPVIRAGDTYAIDRNMSREEALAYWMDDEKETFVAVVNGHILGTYYLRANQEGGGSHICNCGYITAEAARGQGIARQMCEHSLTHARETGFYGMQYNLVVSSNEEAVRLWQKLGFDIIGTIPDGFKHPELGLVDAYVMYQIL